jgi:G3E family GTPase
MDVIKSIPITVFTGFLGAGKTSIILALLPLMPKDYKVVLLKNEFGDVEGNGITLICKLIYALTAAIQCSLVDSQLAKQSSLAAVSEILNGCM